jgi:hypothetical protein
MAGIRHRDQVGLGRLRSRDAPHDSIGVRGPRVMGVSSHRRIQVAEVVATGAVARRPRAGPRLPPGNIGASRPTASNGAAISGMEAVFIVILAALFLGERINRLPATAIAGFAVLEGAGSLAGPGLGDVLVGAVDLSDSAPGPTPRQGITPAGRAPCRPAPGASGGCSLRRRSGPGPGTTPRSDPWPRRSARAGYRPGPCGPVRRAH